APRAAGLTKGVRIKGVIPADDGDREAVLTLDRIQYGLESFGRNRRFGEDDRDTPITQELRQILNVVYSKFFRRADTLQAFDLDAVGGPEIFERVVASHEHSPVGRKGVNLLSYLRVELGHLIEIPLGVRAELLLVRRIGRDQLVSDEFDAFHPELDVEPD